MLDHDVAARFVGRSSDFKLIQPIEKGDYVGHPFRGNQWTDSSGISRGGAASTPEDDKRAYELRQAGKSWEDIAKELGYANGGSVRRLAMRHEARLKQNVDPTLVIPPPVKPDKTEDETGTKLSDFADPSSIRAARRLLKEILPDGALKTLQNMHAASGASSEISTQEKQFIQKFEEVGQLLQKAIDAQTEMDLNGGTKEQVAERAETIKNLEIVTRSMWSDNQRLKNLALERVAKILQGTTTDSSNTFVSTMSAASVDEAVALVTVAFKEFGSDETNDAHQFLQAGGDLDSEIEFKRDRAETDPLKLVLSQDSASMREIDRINTSGSLPRERSSMMDRSTLFMTADAMRVTNFSKEIAHKLVQDLALGKRTLTEVLNLTPAQILDRNQETWGQSKGGEDVFMLRDSLRGFEQRVDVDGNPLGPRQKREDPFSSERFAVLGVDARSKLVVDQVQRLLRDPQILKSLNIQAENVSKVPFRVNLSRSGVDEVKEIAAGATVREIEEFLDVARGETNSVTRSEARVKAAVKVLEASGVKFSKPKDVPHTVASARGSSIKPQVEKDYIDTMDAAISFLPRGLTDGSQQGSIISRFQGGGLLNVVALAGTGVRRAHAQNGGNGRVIVSQPRPARRTDGVMSTADRSVMLHEIGHGVEYANPWVRYVEWMTWKDRAGGEKIKGLASITGNKRYRSHEKGVSDEWANKYAGKTYGGQNPSRSETFEILTTGLQSIFFGDERIDDQHRAVVLGILAASSVTK